MATSLTREQWATRIGFILAAVGSAVGLGNMWRFPFQVGEEGGAAFLVVYLLFILLVGLPAMLVEFSLGRNTKRNPVGAVREFGGDAWRYVGGLFIVIGFVILSYYSVVSGWVIRYVIDSFTGAYMDAPGEHFQEIAVGPEAVFFHALFMAVVVAIVAFGIQRGIELAVKVMVPAIVALLVGLAIYAFTLGGAMDAYSFYLEPDVGEIGDNWQEVLPSAAGQAFFTLSLGMGVMITYSSYIAEDRNLAEDGGIIVALDTAIAFIVGLVVFPILFTAEVDPGEPGAGALFISVAEAFGDITLGWLIGALFFGTVLIAALSSAISLIEVVVSYAIDEHGIDRKRATLGIGAGIFLLGIPVTYDLAMVDLYDILAAEILLVSGAILVVVLVGWLTADRAIGELEKGIGPLGRWGDAWIWIVRVPLLVVLALVLVLSVLGYVEFLQDEFIPEVLE